MRWHIIEGKAGCAFAKEHGHTVVVVDALRASCTAAMLFDVGATDITLVPDISTALAWKSENPNGLLFGERDGLPPEGFDFGNSPRDVEAASGKSVGFTTSNGTSLMLEAWGAPEIYMASVTNSLALVQHLFAVNRERDVVLIPAGKIDDPEFSAQEDWVAAASIVTLTEHEVGEGATEFREWRHMVSLDGVANLFATAPHSDALREIALEEDIAFCARPNITNALPKAHAKTDFGIVLRRT